MPTIQQVLERIQSAKAERKEIKRSFDDVLTESETYVEAKGKSDAARADVKNLRDQLLAAFPNDVEQLEKLNAEIRDNEQMLTDLALSMLVKGENIDVKNYEPRFKVSFRQIALF